MASAWTYLVDSLVSDEVRETNDSELIAEARRQGVQRYIDKPLFVTLRMSFEYSLPETAATVAAKPGSFTGALHPGVNVISGAASNVNSNNNNNNNNR